MNKTLLVFLILILIPAQTVSPEDLVDILNVPTDLVTPKVSNGNPAPGKRVRQSNRNFVGSDVYHVLYLPTDWRPGKKYPVIVEYAGNKTAKNPGTVEDCNLGYGLTAGKGAIWICMPFVDLKNRKNALNWWGDTDATVAYCKETVKHVCNEYGGDPSQLFLAGFSRGAIACNYIGLHDDEIASLWKGFICHSHYDGVRKWNYAESDRTSAQQRLKRLGNRPQFISHEKSVEPTKEYLKEACPDGNFTFVSMPFHNHVDSWVLRDIPERAKLREWYQETLKKFNLSVSQITHGPEHHFFGYIGQCQTIPWNKSGRYILSLRTTFHDRMPQTGELAEIVLIDTHNNNQIHPVEKTGAWNFQQGTMLYWNPDQPETRFFFNDRDPETNRVFTVLYDIKEKKRIREYHYAPVSVANGGVAPTGTFFMAINYGRMARLRPVTGYPGASNTTSQTPAPENDGIFRINIKTGQKKLIVSFRQLRELLRSKHEQIDQVEFYINHTLVNRTGEYLYFYARGRLEDDPMAVNIPCSCRTDGSELTFHQYIGGHPEWDKGTVVIGALDGKQVRYNILQKKIIGEIATKEILPKPKGDIALSPDGNWLVCGYGVEGSSMNQYSIFRRSDGSFAHSPPFSRGPYRKGELRIDPAPRWNRNQSAILVPGRTKEGTRQLHLIRIR